MSTSSCTSISPGLPYIQHSSEEHSFLFQQFKINFLMTKMKHAIRLHLDVNYVIKTINKIKST